MIMKKSRTAAKHPAEIIREERKRKQKRAKRIHQYAKNSRQKSLSETDLIRLNIEIEKEERNSYLMQALQGLDTRKFMQEWSEFSLSSRDDILKFAARSFGTIDGFDQADRALQGPLKMENAGIDIAMVIDLAGKISKIAFFEILLEKSGLDEEWKRLSMNLFIEREINPAPKPQPSKTDKSDIFEQLKRVIEKPVRNDPFPVQRAPKPKKERKKYVPRNPVVTQRS